jgi:hypothetical protein
MEEIIKHTKHVGCNSNPPSLFSAGVYVESLREYLGCGIYVAFLSPPWKLWHQTSFKPRPFPFKVLSSLLFINPLAQKFSFKF